jgi:uncharacterized protein YyaL (SSP411 family)
MSEVPGDNQPSVSDEAERRRHTNRLIHESSPYLLQHAHNPVDWYPWGEEAFARAVAEDKPILLSVGYSACHWCHRLREESFADERTAAIINRHFVSIKVDREQRPDIDALYMDAVVALTGSGGWPLTVFLVPDGAPFFGGTYFPPQDRYGMPGFPKVLETVAELYASRRADVEQQAEEFRQFYRRRSAVSLTLPGDVQAGAVPVQADLLEQASDRLLASIDAIHGGFGRAPKFPHPMGLEFLLRMETRAAAGIGDRGAENAPVDTRRLPLVRLTLDKMADGGIYDQIGGGFHRYSTDAHWLVPHFEKMLYDNALLVPVYLHAWQLTDEHRYRRIAEEILDYVLREMTGPEGGFYSTQDADSDGEEGLFYLWTPDQLVEALGGEDAAVIQEVWGVRPGGNFEGRSILHFARPEVEAANALGMSPSELRTRIEQARHILYQVRARRNWPGRDDKVLTAWNGLMLRAMAEAGRILERDDYRWAAMANADFLLEHLVVEGRLRRSWRDGTATVDAYLEDYAGLVNGLISTFETTGEARFLTQARQFADLLLDLFFDESTSSFFDTSRDHEALVGRPRELTDNATPSGTSLAAEALLRLTSLFGETGYREYAARVLVPLAPAMADQPSAYGHFLAALDDLVGPMQEIAVVVAPEDPGAPSLQRVLAGRYLPRAVLAMTDAADEKTRAEVPLLQDRDLVGGKSTAYVCQDFVCRQPVTDADELLRSLYAGQ